MLFDGDLVIQLLFREKNYCHNFRHLGIVGQLFVLVVIHVVHADNTTACIYLLDDPSVALTLTSLT